MTVNWMGESVKIAARRMGESGIAAAANGLKSAAVARAPIDTGRLRASTVLRQAGLRAIVAFTAPYAAPVHAKTPFLKSASDGFDLVGELAKVLRF